MTAGEIYRRALSYLYDREGRDPEFQRCFHDFLNALLVEALPCQNSRRAAADLPPLTAPEVRAAEDEIDYDDELCALALPYGLAAYFFADEGEDGKAAAYRERFIAALSDLSRAAPAESADCY